MTKATIDPEERKDHFCFMLGNHGRLADCAEDGYAKVGRGAVIVGPGWDGPGANCEVAYAPLEILETIGDDPFVARMCERYDPEHLMVIVFYSSEIRSAYTIHMMIPATA